MTKPAQCTRLIPYYGGAASVAQHVGRQLAGARYVVCPFAGGMSELLHLLDANTLIVGDLNRHVINLANVVKYDRLRAALVRDLRRVPFHEDALRDAQAVCRRVEAGGFTGDSFEWAKAYFVACWMGRNGTAGTGAEFRSGLSVRTDGNGGDSAGRFRTATESLRAWRRIMPRCNFLVRDALQLLAETKDDPDNAIYADPPWPADGDKYAHSGGDTPDERRAFQVAVRDALARFEKARVVVRYGDHPLIRELYADPKWRWIEVAGRTANKRKRGDKREVLIVNGEVRE